MRVYGNLDLFRLVAADAGSCSLQNASLSRSYCLHDLFGLKNTQPPLLAEARRLLDCVPVERAQACSEPNRDRLTARARLSPAAAPAVARRGQKLASPAGR